MKEYGKLPFTKMHGAGNDYVYVNLTGRGEAALAPEAEQQYDWAETARRVSDRHFGVGGDGLVLILNGDDTDFRMRMFNADGSEAQMCGNASRCIAKYVYEKGLTDKAEVTMMTLGGLKRLIMDVRDGKVQEVTVDMGEPRFTGVFEDATASVNATVAVGGETFTVSAVNMGNPHGVIFVDEVTDRHVHVLGPVLEVHPLFPQKANIEFARVVNRGTIEMRVWERGTGETLACGTGACATAVAGVLRGSTDRDVTIRLKGGDLKIHWDKDSNHVFMTGPATFVCDGVAVDVLASK